MKLVEELKKEWLEYCHDPKVANNPNPPLGIVFTFEGFWMWLLEKHEEKK